jgi:hypothetical protein
MIEEDMRIQPSRVAKSNIKRLRIVDYSVWSHSGDADWKRSGDVDCISNVLVDAHHDDNEDVVEKIIIRLQ